MSTRRDFVKFLALIAAGTAARPEQIAAFEEYYEANAPRADDLVAVDEISISGLASSASNPMNGEFYANDRPVLCCGMNLFGGVYFWRAAADSKIVVSRPDFFWRLRPAYMDSFSGFHLQGHVKYVDSVIKVRDTVLITKLEGSLVDP